MAAYVKELMRKKDDIENSIKTWFEVLNSQGNVGMEEPLVDSDGFPRNDIDLVQVRTARHNIICLQNDHKAIMKQIENGLIEYHAQMASMNTNDSANQTAQSAPQTTTELIPFAAIDLISRSSPAEAAGLKLGDVILQFGSVTKQNFTGLSAIGNVVKHSVGKPVNVLVKRENDKVVLSLTPQEWGGRGLLGCNIVGL